MIFFKFNYLLLKENKYIEIFYKLVCKIKYLYFFFLSFRLPELGLCPTPEKIPDKDECSNSNTTNTTNTTNCNRSLKKKLKI